MTLLLLTDKKSVDFLISPDHTSIGFFTMAGATTLRKEEAEIADRFTCAPHAIGSVTWLPARQIPHFLVSMSGRLLRANSEAVELLGYSRATLFRRFRQLMISPWPAHRREAFVHDLSRHRALRLLETFRRPNGERLVCELWCQWFEVHKSIEVYLIAHDQEAETHWALAARLQSLTQRQRQILDLMMQGFSTLNISLLLNLSERTVEAHRAGIRRKLGPCAPADLVCTLA